MFGSWKLGKLFGIDLYVHGTFWLLPLLILFGGVVAGDTSGVPFDLAFVFAVFGCVALHEVGHALAARYYGIGTRDITLYPIGGVASLERMPDQPGREIVIALAGPLVNLVIAAGLFASIVLGNAVVPGSWTAPGLDVLDQFAVRVFWANVVLFGFNLLPAFPMDGGRVLRALLATSMTRVRATQIAVAVGGFVAAGFFVLGLLSMNVMLMVLAAVVFLLGKAELAAVRVQEASRQWREGYADWFAPDHGPEARGPSDGFTGWKWDPTRRVWTEWRYGTPIREVRVM